MRTYGRTFALNPDGTMVKPQPAGFPRWEKIETDAQGRNDMIHVVTLCQVLLLNLGESPFFAQYGIPAVPTVVQQVQPDYYVTRVQSQFAPFFANLVVAKQGSDPPTYKINVTTQQGVRIAADVEIPQ